MKKLLAMDFGGTFVKYALIDNEGSLTGRGEIPAPLAGTEDFIRVIRELYETCREEIDGIAVSMPGVIDSDTGYLHSAGAYTQTMGKKNLFELLKDIEVPVSVENDGKAAVLAEAWKGALQGIRDGAAVIIGSGLGGGIIMDGKLRKGGHFASGEISGLLMEPGVYEFGNFAATKAAMSALLSNVARAKGMSPAQFEVSGFMNDEKPDPDLPIYSGRDVFKWVDEGDPVTTEVYQEWIKALVMVIYNLKMTLDPEKIVIGGGVSRNPRLIRDIQAEYDKAGPLMAAFGMPEAKIETCRFTADANLLGAVYNWILHFEQE